MNSSNLRTIFSMKATVPIYGDYAVCQVHVLMWCAFRFRSFIEASFVSRVSLQSEPHTLSSWLPTPSSSCVLCCIQNQGHLRFQVAGGSDSCHTRCNTVKRTKVDYWATKNSIFGSDWSRRNKNASHNNRKRMRRTTWKLLWSEIVQMWDSQLPLYWK